MIRFIFLLFFACISGCNPDKIPEGGKVKAHVIEYKVNYLNDRAGSIPTAVLPGKMTVVFADHYALTRIDGFFGQFSLSFIANLKSKSVINLVKIFDKKFVCYGEENELPVCIVPIDSISIKETGTEMELAGFKCKKLIISSTNAEDFYVLSTNAIKVKTPNSTTPYKNINEVLLMFNTSLSLLKMRVIAKNYEEKEVPWEIFQVPKDYQNISKSNMEQIIMELFK